MQDMQLQVVIQVPKSESVKDLWYWNKTLKSFIATLSLWHTVASLYESTEMTEFNKRWVKI